MSEPAPSPIHDSKAEWVKKQIEEYIATDGKKPEFRGGAPLVLITYRGRKSGEWRRTCLIGASDGNDVIIVASKGGAPDHPVWYKNIEANPRVWVQQGAESFWTTAHTADAADKPRLWDLMVGYYADYADYQKKTDRDIPVVVLVRD
ncbi:MAG TPA: nitroreductase family deazaflavin-dependent oxidoreductase [Galbitalea sp.]|jgi:deazaflavin-dependent oxidoreductase (nitroreductase family)|nr:nitroreductase family deazaflavin-dependent oxidoreductase [Galbitalea sp.]